MKRSRIALCVVVMVGAVPIARALLPALVLRTGEAVLAAGQSHDGRAERAAVQPVSVTPNEPAKRVDIAIGGRPFTSYIWPAQGKKAGLDPIRGGGRTLVTPRGARGWRGGAQWPRGPASGSTIHITSASGSTTRM